MKKIDLGQAIGILANVGVIAGILFLAYEIQQNNEFLAAQVSSAHHDSERQRRSVLATNDGGMAEIVVKSIEGQDLDSVEEFRLRIYYNNLLEDFEWQFGEVQAGRLPEERLNVTNWRAIWNTQPGIVGSFEGSRSNRNPAFVEYWEENVVSQR